MASEIELSNCRERHGNGNLLKDCSHWSPLASPVTLPTLYQPTGGLKERADVFFLFRYQFIEVKVFIVAKILFSHISNPLLSVDRRTTSCEVMIT